MIRVLTAMGIALALSHPALAQEGETNAKVTEFPMREIGLPSPSDVRGWVDAYFESIRDGDAGSWADAFAPGALLDEPVGAPIKDSRQEIIAQGKAFFGAFESVGLQPSFIHIVGREAAVHWMGRGTATNGAEVEFEGISLFTFNDDGEIVELRGFYVPPGR